MGKRLCYARKKRGWTQTELARQASVKQPNLSKIERGETQKTTDLGALSRALRVSIAWLELDDQPEPDWNDPGQPALLLPERATLAEVIERLGAMLHEVNAATRRGILALLGSLVDDPGDAPTIGQQAQTLFELAKRRSA